jgi:hypothetical protein
MSEENSGHAATVFTAQLARSGGFMPNETYGPRQQGAEVKRAVAFALSIAALATLTAVAQAHHKPGHQGGPGQGGPGQGQNRLTIAARPNPVVYFRTTSVFGRFRAQNNAGRTIALQRDRWPFEGNWVSAGTDTTDAQGDYSFSARPPVNTRYRTRRSGTNLFSAPVTVGVRIRVSRAVSDRTPEVGQRVRFRGRACPQHDGALVRIQRFNRSLNRWRTVRRTVLRDYNPGRDTRNCSRYRRTFRVFRDGTYRVVVISPHGDHRNGISRRIRLDAHN